MAKQASQMSAKPATIEKTAPQEKTLELPQYNVILLNDNDHTYEYVIHMLKSLFGYEKEKGFELAKSVDKQGRAIVITTHKERAELKRDQIMSFGTDDRVASCKGSMSSVIEPVG